MLVYPFFPFWYYCVLKQKCDLIIDVENGVPFFSRLFIFNKKILLLVHHYHGEVLLTELKFPINRLAYHLEKHVMPIIYGNHRTIAVSLSTKNELGRIGFNPDKIEIIHNGIEQYDGIRYQKYKIPTVCYVGRFKQYKNLEHLIKMFANVHTKIPSAKLIIAGRGGSDEIFSYNIQIKQLGLDNAVSIIHNPSENKKWEIFGKSWVFATCSKKEGWCITVIEANAVGTPAIGYNVSGLRDSIVPKLNGELANNNKEFEKLLTKYLSKPDYRSAVVEYSKRFTWDESTAKIAEVIEKYKD